MAVNLWLDRHKQLDMGWIAQALQGAHKRAIVLNDNESLPSCISKVAEQLKSQDVTIIGILDAPAAMKKDTKGGLVIADARRRNIRADIPYELDDKVGQEDRVVEQVFRELKARKLLNPLI